MKNIWIVQAYFCDGPEVVRIMANNKKQQSCCYWGHPDFEISIVKKEINPSY